MLWRRSWVADQRARALADRHYSRVTVGAREFAPPGYKVVLVLPNHKALWVSHAVKPGIVRADGFDYWYCSIFRNESNRLASVLIRQAIEATLWCWSHWPLPEDGFRTFIDERKVQSMPGRPHGWTFMAVGFEVVGRTKVRDYLTLQLPRERLAQFTPRPAANIGGGVQMGLFGEETA